jgi:hypothetical protein
MQRFQIEPGPIRREGPTVLLWCTRCETWTAETDDPLSLAELVQRADEHTEVCR